MQVFCLINDVVAIVNCWHLLQLQLECYIIVQLDSCLTTVLYIIYYIFDTDRHFSGYCTFVITEP